MSKSNLFPFIANVPLKIVVCFAAVLVAVIENVSKAPPTPQTSDEVRAKRFILADDKGFARACLMLDPDGNPSFMMMDDKYKIRLFMGVDKKAASITVNDENQTVRGGMLVLGDGSITTALSDSRGNDMIRVSVDKDGKPSLILLDKAGTCRFQMGLQGADGASISIRDKNGAARVGLFSDGTGSGLGINGKDGKPRAMLMGADASSALVLTDERGDPRTALRFTIDGPSLTLKDANGTDRLVAGVTDSKPVGRPTAGRYEPTLIFNDANGKATHKLP